MKILETERLLLRGLEQGDFKDVCKLLQDDEVMYAYEGAFNDQEVQNWLDRQFGRYRHDGFGLWGVVEKGSNELIGQCGITYQEFDGKRVPEIGYLFRKEFWHAIAPRYFLGSNIGIPYDRIDLFETKRMESILPTSDSSFDSKALMPKLLSKKVTDFRDSFSVKFLISNTTLPN